MMVLFTKCHEESIKSALTLDIYTRSSLQVRAKLHDLVWVLITVRFYKTHNVADNVKLCLNICNVNNFLEIITKSWKYFLEVALFSIWRLELGILIKTNKSAAHKKIQSLLATNTLEC